MPGIVVELAIRWLHQSLEGTGAQVDDQAHGPAFQRQVDVVGRLAGVQQETVSLQRSEGQGDFICAALDRLLGQVVAEELITLERGHWLHLALLKGDRKRQEKVVRAGMDVDQGYENWLLLIFSVFRLAQNQLNI